MPAWGGEVVIEHPDGLILANGCVLEILSYPVGAVDRFEFRAVCDQEIPIFKDGFETWN
jgi:hypothetical protein